MTYRHVPKDKPSKAREKRVVATQPAVDPDGDAAMQSAPGAEEQEAKRPKKAPEASAGKGSKAPPWFPEGGKRVKNEGGDCLFYALADGLKVHAPEQQASARSVRAFLHAWMTKRKEEYAALWDGVKAGVANKEAAPDWKGGFEDYLNDIRVAGSSLLRPMLASATSWSLTPTGRSLSFLMEGKRSSFACSMIPMSPITSSFQVLCRMNCDFGGRRTGILVDAEAGL